MKQITKRLLAFILCVATLFALLPTQAPQARAYSETDVAYPVEGGNIYFDKSTGTITGADITVTSSNIPAEIDGVAVTSIGDSAFRYCGSLMNVTIPDSVTSIGEGAFGSCYKLKTIIIPDSVGLIGEYAFSFSGLTSITIGSGIKNIYSNAFRSCDELVSVYISDLSAWCKIRFWYGECTPFTYASELYINGVLATDITIPDDITAIMDSTFRGCDSLTSVSIPNSVTSIGEYAFNDCDNLASVIIPDSVTSIASYAFSHCVKLSIVSIGSGLNAIGDYAFAYCENLSHVAVDADIVEFTSNAFNETAYYKDNANWDSGALYVGNHLIHAENPVSEEFVVRDNTRTIASNAFLNTGIVSITIPNSLAYIGEDAFEGCGQLSRVYINDIAAWCNIEFANHISNPHCYATELYIKGELVTDITLPNSITNIKAHTFYGCDSIASIAIPDSVTIFGFRAFCFCTNLTNIKIPTSVTEIRDCAFQNCFKLKNITIPNSVTTLGASVFSNCINLANVVVPESVTALGEFAFYGCQSLSFVAVLNQNCEIDSNTHQVFGDKEKVTVCGYANSTAQEYAEANAYSFMTIDCANDAHCYIDDGASSATCTENGKQKKTCFICGNSITQDIEATGHNYIDGVCDVCSEAEPDEEPPAEKPTQKPEEPIKPIEKPEEPTDPSEKPTEKPEEPTEPSEKPTEKPEEPTEPSEKPSEKPEEPTEPEEKPEPVIPTENPFKDVKKSDYFCDPVLWAVGKGITNGMSATSFAPNANCTRGQIVTFLWRACGSPEPAKKDNPFKDVKSNEYYYKAVLWAVENGITTGLSATTFGPNATCTRGQVATFLWRSQGEPAPKSTNNPFKDVKSSDYYFKAVLWAVENEVTQGMGGGKFAPNASCTRGQIVTFLFRAIA